MNQGAALLNHVDTGLSLRRVLRLLRRADLPIAARLQHAFNSDMIRLVQFLRNLDERHDLLCVHNAGPQWQKPSKEKITSNDVIVVMHSVGAYFAFDELRPSALECRSLKFGLSSIFY